MTDYKKTMDSNNESDTPTLHLDCDNWSSDWEDAIDQALPHFSRMEVPMIHCVLPIPGKAETLIFYNDNQCYHSRNRTLTTLQHKEEAVLFQDYTVTCRVLDRLGDFLQRRNPIISDNFVLFPLTAPKHSIWINPLSIVEIKEIGQRTFIQLASGPGLFVRVKKPTLVNYSANALLAYACSKRDLSGSAPLQTEQPLDIISLSNTPFARQISKKHKLHTFKIPAGDYRSALFAESILSYFLNLMRYVDLENLTVEKLTELLRAYK